MLPIGTRLRGRIGKPFEGKWATVVEPHQSGDFEVKLDGGVFFSTSSALGFARMFELPDELPGDKPCSCCGTPAYVRQMFGYAPKSTP